ncbi:MAG: hypothetical protein GXW85_04740 [Clostridia bacterium]|nr:hypothetical protein [Clostridia bacterium]
MDKKLELIHTEEKFSLKIGGNEIPNVKGYSITARAQSNEVDLELEISIPIDEIVIESCRPKLQ